MLSRSEALKTHAIALLILACTLQAQWAIADDSAQIHYAEPAHYSAFERLFIDVLGCQARWPSVLLHDARSEALVDEKRLPAETGEWVDLISAQSASCGPALAMTELAQFVDAGLINRDGLTLIFVDIPPVLAGSPGIPGPATERRDILFEAFVTQRDARRVLVWLPSAGMQSGP